MSQQGLRYFRGEMRILKRADSVAACGVQAPTVSAPLIPLAPACHSELRSLPPQPRGRHTRVDPASSRQATRQRAPPARTARRAQDRGKGGVPRLGPQPVTPGPPRGGGRRRARAESREPAAAAGTATPRSASTQSPSLSVPLLPRLRNEGNNRAQVTALLMQAKHINIYEALRKVPSAR